jgi:hypothetical protein
MPVRGGDAPVQDVVDDDDLEPPPGRLREAAGAYAQCHGDLGPVLAPRGVSADNGA